MGHLDGLHGCWQVVAYAATIIDTDKVKKVCQTLEESAQHGIGDDAQIRVLLADHSLGKTYSNTVFLLVHNF